MMNQEVFSGNGIAVSKDGILKEGQAAFETLTGEKIILKKGDALNISVQIRGKPLWFINNGMKNINHR